jgi:hypothetical protein
MTTPTYERRFYLDLLKRNLEEQEEAEEEGTSTQITGKGRRATTISGQALKNKLKNNEIPNE